MILHPSVFHKDGDLVVVELLAFPVDQSRIVLVGVVAELGSLRNEDGDGNENATKQWA